MRTNHVKAKLRRGEASFGIWLNHSSPQQARLLARLGFDWLLIDAEHGAYNPTLMAEIIASIADAGTECAPLVRVPHNTVEWFKWALDAGAWGVIVPMVNTVEEAQQAVSWAKYPPVGTRSIGSVFAPLAFDTPDWPSYARIANDEILVVLQIESMQGLRNIDAIVGIPGVDVAFVGPNDLHAQLGLLPSNEGTEPEFVQALEQISASARQRNVALGIFTSGGDAAAQRVREGFQMVSVTSDLSSLLMGAAQHLKNAQNYRQEK
ncbi:MAG: 4-hydroxy-2-oxoheptanedioate aldolase [Ktedonobacteraceae bacterium]